MNRLIDRFHFRRFLVGNVDVEFLLERENHVKLATPAGGDSLPARTRWIVTTDPIDRKDFGLAFGNATESVSGISSNVTPTIEIEAAQK